MSFNTPELETETEFGWTGFSLCVFCFAGLPTVLAASVLDSLGDGSVLDSLGDARMTTNGMSQVKLQIQTASYYMCAFKTISLTGIFSCCNAWLVFFH